MSYRDLRNFTEMMRALGYKRLISMENFRSPNFPLVGEILIWLVKRFDSDADVHMSFTTEEDRVLLIRTAAQFLALKANIILNTKKLYQADGFAVKELLKVVLMLYQSIQINETPNAFPQTKLGAKDWADISSKIQDLKLSRELASQVVNKAATIYELLNKEVELRESRTSSISNQLEINNIENGLKQAVDMTRQNIASVKSLIENVSAAETGLDAKIEKKKLELERSQKRLQTLKKVRPAFLEEFEKLEIELQSLYQDYVSRIRCLNYLEQVHEEAALAEQEMMIQRQKETRILMEELQLEDARKLMEGDDDEDDLELMNNQPAKEQQNNKPNNPQSRRLRTATSTRARETTGRKRVVGSMSGAGDGDESLDSDSSILIDEDEDMNSDDEELLLASPDPIDGLPNNVHSDQQDDDDDDF